MTDGQAALLGIVQGLTEFLPVSSDGHLTLLQAWLDIREASLAFDVALHIGTLAAVLIFFSRDLARIARSVFAKDGDPSDRRRALYIVVATVPTGIIGLALKPAVEGLVHSFAAAGAGFLGTALLLAAGERAFARAGRAIGEIPWWHAAMLGVAQGLAVWPGLSRSGSTIAVALLLGWRWEEAGRFSFLMSIPAVAGATLLEARALSSMDASGLGLGIALAFASGFLALHLLMKFLAARRLWPFAAYCAALGIVALIKAGG